MGDAAASAGITTAGDPDEGRRLSRLRGTGLLDSPPEAGFDRITRLAARFLRVPMALVSFVDGQRQFFKSDFGLPEPWRTRRETPASYSFCRLVVAQGRPLVVGDARKDEELRGLPAVTDLGVVAYLGVPLKAVDGLVLGALCVIDGQARDWGDDEVETLVDLAASVMTEVELREQLARSHQTDRQLRLLSSAVEEANDAIVIGEAGPVESPGPRVVYVNKAFTRGTGYRPEEIVGRTPRILQGPKTDRATLDAIRSRLEQWEPVRAELVNYHKDGSEFWVELNIRPAPDATGQYTHWISIQRDVTERKLAEDRLRESERTLRAIFDTTFQFIGLLAPDGTLREANRTSLEFAGVELDEVVGLRSSRRRGAGSSGSRPSRPAPTAR
jgi:PAS domain S-box-containing protein